MYQYAFLTAGATDAFLAASATLAGAPSLWQTAITFVGVLSWPTESAFNPPHSRRFSDAPLLARMTTSFSSRLRNRDELVTILRITPAIEAGGSTQASIRLQNAGLPRS